MVGTERLELSHLAALEPKSSASTNFATSPLNTQLQHICNEFHKTWQRIKDSNLDERFWRPSCYHYTNPLLQPNIQLPEYRLVGTERLELSHLAALEPKSSASTNFATSPMAVYIIEITPT